MKAMLLAAGRGARMGSLTDSTPKPLLKINGQTIIEMHIKKLVAAGISEIVINHAWLGAQIESYVGDGRQWSACVEYSREAVALETAGGIANALSLLGSKPFALLSADIYSEFDYARLRSIAVLTANTELNGVCVMVPNPAHHIEGDFGCAVGLMRNAAETETRYTYSGIGVFRPTMFDGLAKGQPEKLVTLLKRDIPRELLGAELYFGRWDDVGTPERLAQIDHYLADK